MWLQHRISDFSRQPAYVYQFDQIYALANCMKNCHYYLFSHQERKLYGCSKEGYVLNYIHLPATMPAEATFSFRFDLIDPKVLMKFHDFVLYPEAPYMLLPIATLAEHHNYQVQFAGRSEGWNVVDTVNNIFAPYVDLHGIDIFEGANANKFRYIDIISDLVRRKRTLDNVLGVPQVFYHMETNSVIEQVRANKAVAGALLLPLTDMNGKRYGMKIYKSLFPLNKGDDLTIAIRDLPNDPANRFEATFITARKKSPVPTIEPHFVQSVSAFFINII